MPKKIPVGVSNFAKLITENYLFVDKSLIIKDLIESGAEVSLITRPRRWGKTLFMSMLEHFFAATVNGQNTSGLFNSLKIAAPEYESIMQYQGKYPVIFITLKDIKEKTYSSFFQNIKDLIQEQFRRYEHLLNTSSISSSQKKIFELYLNGDANEQKLAKALKFLSEVLFRVHNKKVFILIDEYDAPVNSATEKDQREKISDFLGKLFGAALKDNNYLEKGFLTGILRLAKAGIFSGLNNLTEYTLLDDTYKQYFGFTETEIKELFVQQNLAYNLKQVKAWYNGYLLGEEGLVLYNPWSIMSCLGAAGKLQSYWVDTANNVLIKTTLANASIQIKQQLETLIQGDSNKVKIDKHITFEELNSNPISIWSLLFNSGYITVETAKLNIENTYTCRVKIPNQEVKGLYIKYIKEWFATTELAENYNRFITSLITGRIEEFKNDLKQFLLDSFSYFDTGGHNPEKVYHAFVLGLVADLHKTYAIRSNRESGSGRYDVLLLPHNKKALGIVLEFKSIDRESSPEILLQTTQNALVQIKERKYHSELRQHDIENKLFIAITFAGKELELLSEAHLTESFDAETQLSIYEESQSPFSSEYSSPRNLISSKFETALFGEITGTTKQVIGEFNGEMICFDIHQTKGDGNCGFYSLPIPYDRAGVTQLLLAHSQNPEIRKLVAPEIIEACKANYLPSVIQTTFSQFFEFNQYENQTDLDKGEMLRTILDQIDPNRDKLSDRNFETVMQYLATNQTEGNQALLLEMQRFQQAYEEKLADFKNFCESEMVFKAFCEHYIGSTGQLSFSVGGLNFHKGTSFLDAILKLTNPPIYLVIWEPNTTENNVKTVKIVYEGGNREAGSVTHIFHTPGQATHFELMSENQPIELDKVSSRIKRPVSNIDSTEKSDENHISAFFPPPPKCPKLTENPTENMDSNISMDISSLNSISSSSPRN